MRNLSKHYHVTGMDLRNHGASAHDSSMSYCDMAADVAETIVELRLEPYSLLGHSMGGKVAMTLAQTTQAQSDENSSHRCPCPDKLIIVDIAPRFYPPHHYEILAAMDNLDTTALKSRKDADQMLKHTITDTAIRQFILKNLARQSDGGYRWQLNLSALLTNYEQLQDMPEFAAQSNRFRNPLLVLRGGMSNYVIKSDLALFDKLFPDNQLITINGAGHWPHASHAAEVQNAILEFLAN